MEKAFSSYRTFAHSYAKIYRKFGICKILPLPQFSCVALIEGPGNEGSYPAHITAPSVQFKGLLRSF